MLWWFGLAAWILGVIPLLAWLLYRLLRPIEEIRRYADDVREHGDGLAEALAKVDLITVTSEEAARFERGVHRYVDTLDGSA